MFKYSFAKLTFLFISVATRGPKGGAQSCGYQLCECDQSFVECLRHLPCPRYKAMCMESPLRYWQNFLMDLPSGFLIRRVDRPHHSNSLL